MHAEESVHDVLCTLVSTDRHGILLRCADHVTSNLGFKPLPLLLPYCVSSDASCRTLCTHDMKA